MPILEQETSVYPEQLLVDPPYLNGGPVPEDEDDGMERRWWAVYTKARQEKAFARDLLRHEIPFYLPIVE